MHNLGVLVDSSMHWGSNYGGPGSAGDYYVLGGLQYKYHTDTFSPFVRVFAGALRQVAPGYPNTPIHSIDQWNAALGAGGGFDYNVWHGENSSLAIRVAQVDYIYSNYNEYLQVHFATVEQRSAVGRPGAGLGQLLQPAADRSLYRATDRSDGRRAGHGDGDGHELQSEAHR